MALSLMNYQQLLDSYNFKWATILSPTLNSMKKFQKIVHAFEIKKVVLPDRKIKFKKWLQESYCKNCVSYLLSELNEDNFITSSGDFVDRNKLEKRC